MAGAVLIIDDHPLMVDAVRMTMASIEPDRVNRIACLPGARTGHLSPPD